MSDPRPLRVDAERNRRLILDTARTVFAERGLEAGFDEIARAAGVGVGTVYRRFPDRDDLIDALFVERLDSMVDDARAALARPDPAEALRWFMERSITAQAADRGFKEVLGTGTRGTARMATARARMAPAVTEVVERAKAAGVLRPGVETLDLAVLASTLALLVTPAHPELWRRYLTVALDGLSSTYDEPLPLDAPDEDDLDHVMRRAGADSVRRRPRG